MLCRAILTAIAITYVICMLLISGLQKDELDANTMEKLRRHNVNIYDMNNESLREECLLKSLGAGKEKKDVKIHGNKNETMIIPAYRKIQSEGLAADSQKTRVAPVETYFDDKTSLRNLINEIKLKFMLQREQNRNNNIRTGSVIVNQDEINVKLVDEDKVPQVEYMKSQPSLDSVLKFWSKFTRKVDDIIDTTTTYNPPRMEEIQSTVNYENNGYVHSREMEYINRVMAEYFANQTVPTTTQATKRNEKNIEYISRKIKEELAKKAKDEQIDLNTAIKNMGAALNVRTLSDLTQFSGPIRINNKPHGVATRKNICVTLKDTTYDNSETLRRPEGIPNESVTNVSPKTTARLPATKIEALKYLDAVLRLNKKSKINNEPILYSEITTQESITSTEEQGRHETKNNIRYNAEDLNNTNKDVIQTQSKDIANDQVTVSTDIIKEIAEKVKEIVLKDIRKDVTEMPTTVTTTTTPTMFSTTATSNTEEAAISLKDTKNGKQVIQTFMELFKEYKTMTETNAPAKVTLKPDVPTTNNGVRKVSLNIAFRNPSLDRMLPPLMAGMNPYKVKDRVPKLMEMSGNPYEQSLVQIPLGPADRVLQAVPYNPPTKIYQRNEYRMIPITIQTNSVEVPPLAIPLSKPMPLINQHIIVTTPNPFKRHKEVQLQRENKQRFDSKYREVLNVGDERNQHVEIPTYADLAKKLQATENIKNEFRDTYKHRIEKLKERIKYAHEQNRVKARELSRALVPDHHMSVNRLMDQNFQGSLEQNVGLNRHGTLNRPANLNRNDVYNLGENRDTYNRQLDLNLREPINRAIDLNSHDTVNRPANLNQRENLNHPLDPTLHEILNRQLNPNHHESYNRPIGSSHRESLNRPVDSIKYLTRPEDPSQRDIITREVLSRLVGSNHHDVSSRLVEPSPRDVINRPVDLNHQSRSHHSDAYERIEHEGTHPRYKGARFHEELERIDSLPRNNYGSNKMPSNCCDAVAARQQMPLTKIKPRGRFDDTHFKNFLKSQQKVTDMLERILAAKTKQERPQSVEVP